MCHTQRDEHLDPSLMIDALPRREFPLRFHAWRVNFVIGPGNTIALYVNECLRKERQGGPDETLYVWTNLELEWEEHRWLEARLIPVVGDSGRARLDVTINSQSWLRAEVASAGEPMLQVFEVD